MTYYGKARKIAAFLKSQGLYCEVIDASPKALRIAHGILPAFQNAVIRVYTRKPPKNKNPPHLYVGHIEVYATGKMAFAGDPALRELVNRT